MDANVIPREFIWIDESVGCDCVEQIHTVTEPWEMFLASVPSTSYIMVSSWCPHGVLMVVQPAQPTRLTC